MKSTTIMVLLGILLAPGLPWSQETARFSDIQVLLVAQTQDPDGQHPPRGGIHRAKLGETITLYAVVLGRLNGKTVALTQSDALDRTVRILKPDKVPGIELRWFKVTPSGDSYNNTQGGFHWDEIAYQEHPLGGWGKDWQMAADSHPIGYADTHAGAGTMAFKVAVRYQGKVYASPGKESLYRGGLSDDVIRVAFRRDDSFVGRLTELFNTPYIWGSAGVPPEVHQAERLIGSDCADFVVYGARRMGKNIPYRATWHLPQVCTTIETSLTPDQQGRYRNPQGKTVALGEGGVQIGDLLLFHGHVGALAGDRKPLGILDTNDVMIHTFWAPPSEEPIRETYYKDAEVKILRWK